MKIILRPLGVALAFCTAALATAQIPLKKVSNCRMTPVEARDLGRIKLYLRLDFSEAVWNGAPQPDAAPGGHWALMDADHTASTPTVYASAANVDRDKHGKAVGVLLCFDVTRGVLPEAKVGEPAKKFTPEFFASGSTPPVREIFYGTNLLTAAITDVPYSSSAVTLAPASASIEGGGNQWVLHAPLKFTIPNVGDRETANPLQFNFAGAASTQSWDKSASGVADFEQHFTKISDRSFYHTDWSLSYYVNQAFTSRQTVGAYSLSFPWSVFDVHSADVRNVEPGMVILTPVSLIYRDRIDPVLAPYHISMWTLNPSLTFSSPIYYFGAGDNDLESKQSIRASAQGWWFPDDDAIAGYATHRAEGRADLVYSFPLKHPLFGIGGTRLDFSLGYGADPAQGYAVAPRIALTLISFGNTLQVTKWP
jgi:hypothetical protein